MIHYIKVRNFMSFKDEVCLDFEATDDKRFEDYHVVKMADGTRLLRFAVLYGANASGKSNLVNAIQFLSYYWRNVLGQNIGVHQFIFDKQTPNEPSEFEVGFYVGDNRYIYMLKIHGNNTDYEELILDNAEQEIFIARRERSDNHTKLTFNPNIIKLNDSVIELFSANCLASMSFFAARQKINLPPLPHFDVVQKWVMESVLSPITHEMNLTSYWENRLIEDQNKELKNYLLDFIRKADFNIVDIEANIEYQTMHPLYQQSIAQDNRLSEQQKAQLLNQKVQIIKTEFKHTVNGQNDNIYSLPKLFQSNGTLRTIAMGTIIHDVLESNAFVAIDEIETSLHPELIEFIINQFLDTAESRSQMLITTHYAKLLDTVDDILRRDSIWFVEKHKNGSSELYSLIEFKGVDDMDHLHGAYMNGCFGALPHIKF